VAPLLRFSGPAAFLVVATIGLLLLRAAIRDEPATTRAVPVASPRPAPAPAPTPPTATAPAAAPVTARFHEIRAGDTLGAVADRYETSVEALVELNPGIDPTALQVGQQVRVK
jgi:LysM repeat protein